MDEQQAKAIAAIRKYIRGTKRPASSWPKSNHMQASYSRWAIGELISHIQKNPSVPPVILAEELARKMDNYSCVDIRTSLIFSIGKDAIMDILDMLLMGYD